MTKKELLDLYSESLKNIGWEDSSYFLNQYSVENYSYAFFALISVFYFHKINFKGTFKQFLQSPNLKEISPSLNVLSTNFKNYASNCAEKIKSWEGESISTSPNLHFLGDPHPSVSKILNNNTVYFKDALGLGPFWNSLLSALPEFENFFPSYSISGPISSRPYEKVDTAVKDYSEYYFNFGFMTALCLFLKMIDLNQENILIKGGKYPYIFDTEFSFTPKFKNTVYSLKISGLMNGQGVDNNSSLFGGMFELISYLQPLVVLDAHEKPSIKWKIPSKRIINNIPNTTIHPYQYIDDLLKGYDLGCDVIKKGKRTILEIVRASNLSTRLLMRPTRVYRYLALKYFYPQVHLNQSDISFFNSTLSVKAPILFNFENTESIIDAEVGDLCSLEIPYFYTPIHSKDIIHPKKGLVGKLNKTPFYEWLYIYKNYDFFMQRQRNKIDILCELNYSNWLKDKKNS